MHMRTLEIFVGFFILLGIVAILILGIKVSNLGGVGGNDTYQLKARFENIGGLKVRSPVKVGGVVVGRVSAIELDKAFFFAIVTMEISKKFDNFPTETSAAIMTSGLLGEQFIGLSPGGDDEILASGDLIEDTQSALVLEDLIAQFLFSSDSK